MARTREQLTWAELIHKQQAEQLYGASVDLPAIYRRRPPAHLGQYRVVSHYKLRVELFGFISHFKQEGRAVGNWFHFILYKRTEA